MPHVHILNCQSYIITRFSNKKFRCSKLINKLRFDSIGIENVQKEILCLLTWYNMLYVFANLMHSCSAICLIELFGSEVLHFVVRLTMVNCMPAQCYTPNSWQMGFFLFNFKIKFQQIN